MIYQCQNHGERFYCDECSPPSERQTDIDAGREHWKPEHAFDAVVLRMTKCTAELVQTCIEEHKAKATQWSDATIGLANAAITDLENQLGKFNVSPLDKVCPRCGQPLVDTATPADQTPTPGRIDKRECSRISCDFWVDLSELKRLNLRAEHRKADQDYLEKVYGTPEQRQAVFEVGLTPEQRLALHGRKYSTMPPIPVTQADLDAAGITPTGVRNSLRLKAHPKQAEHNANTGGCEAEVKNTDGKIACINPQCSWSET